MLVGRKSRAWWRARELGKEYYPSLDALSGRTRPRRKSRRLMSVPPLAILGCGMTTGVGLTAPASCAAIRARLDGFRETRFMARGGEWIIGSEVPLEEPWRGLRELARLVAGPLRECLDLIPDVPPEKIPVFLCVAEEDRPGRLEGLGNPLFFEACELLGVRFMTSRG